MRGASVCSKPGCPNLRPCPSPGHERPANAPWSRDRNTAAQGRFRRQVLEHDDHTCRRCGHHDPTGRTLDAHHVSSSQGMTLCNAKANGCHAAVDSHAR